MQELFEKCINAIWIKDDQMKSYALEEIIETVENYPGEIDICSTKQCPIGITYPGVLVTSVVQYLVADNPNLPPRLFCIPPRDGQNKINPYDDNKYPHKNQKEAFLKIARKYLVENENYMSKEEIMRLCKVPYHQHGEVIEERALRAVLDFWNTRAEEPKLYEYEE